MKELTAEQKAIVKMNVSRETTEGSVKCSYCDKEISSKNVDRWASHLRGCAKTPDEIKAQIQPFRGYNPAAANDQKQLNVLTMDAQSAAAAHAAAAAAAAAAASSLSVPGNPNAAAAAAAAMNVQTANQVAHLGMTGPTASLNSNGYAEVYKVHVSKDYMKFNAAHFIAYKGYREKLHGHNYKVGVTITGVVGQDGYVVDFGEIKKISRVICNDLNETFLVPMNSDVLKVTFDGTNVHIVTEDMSKFSFPKADCTFLPIVHSSAEELAFYVCQQLVEAFTIVALLERGVRKIEVSISEAKKQMATYERTIFA